MEETHSSYSHTRALTIFVLVAVIFGFSGYYYGSRNPGGFAVGPGPVNDALNVDQGPARDHPGSITTNVNSGLMEYKNDFIGLDFQFPLTWIVQDRWTGDATDLIIFGNTLGRTADIASGKITGDQANFAQFEITFSSSINGLDVYNLGVQNLDEFTQAYSKEHTELLGAVDKSLFTNPEKTTINGLDAYKADNSESNGKGKVYFVATDKGYFQITMRPDSDLTEDVQNTILSNFQFN